MTSKFINNYVGLQCIYLHCIVYRNDYQRYLQYFLDSIYDLLIGLYALKSRHIVCLVDRIQPSLIYPIISQHVTLEERRKKSSMYPSNEYYYYLFKNHIVQEIMLFMKSFKTSLVMVQWYYAKDIKILSMYGMSIIFEFR